ncbi:MAG: bifunctional adenosylcobinamide kinase/adenosylcobinamide-phosphate guanylyltransferase [Elainellaceae cyanobacterium]
MQSSSQIPDSEGRSPNTLTLVTGPARSGKSEWAEWLATEREQAGQSVVYVATSKLDPADAEWTERITKHQRRRPQTWRCVEVPFAVADTVQNAAAANCLLVDSLGTWLANGWDWEEEEWQQQQDALVRSLQTCVCDVIVVAEETGWGVVPAYPLGRTFRDRLGSLTRRIGAIAHTTYLVTGGHVLNLSQLGTPLPPMPDSDFADPEPANPGSDHSKFSKTN